MSLACLITAFSDDVRPRPALPIAEKLKGKRRAKFIPTAVEAAAASALLPYLDRISYGWKFPNGDKSQVSKDRLNLHYHSLWAKRFLYETIADGNLVPTLTAKRIARHVLGKYSLLVRSSWKGRKLLVRIETDQHKGQTDGLAAIEWLRDTFLPTMFICPSENGWSAYIWLQVPWSHKVDFKTGEVTGEIPDCSLRGMNQFRVSIHDAVQALIWKQGFACSVEAHGAFPKKVHDTDKVTGCPQGPSTVAKGSLGPGTTVKLPRFTSTDDVSRFAAAVIQCSPRQLDSHRCNDAGLLKLLSDGRAAMVGYKLKLAADQAVKASAVLLKQFDKMSQERFEAALDGCGIAYENFNPKDLLQLQALVNWKPDRKPGERKTISRVIVASGDKLTDTTACLVIARLLLDVRSLADLEMHEQAIISLGHELYVENGLADGDKDQDRDSRFANAFKFICRTFDEGKAGKGGSSCFIEESHRNEVEHHLRSQPCIIPAVDQYNESP